MKPEMLKLIKFHQSTEFSHPTFNLNGQTFGLALVIRWSVDALRVGFL